MTPKLRLKNVLDLVKVDRPPVAIPTQNATIGAMESCGVYWPQALREPEAMAKLAIASQKSCGLEAVRVPFDICVEADSLGCETRFGGEVDPPTATPKTRDTLNELNFPEKGVTSRMATVVEAAKIAAQDKDDDIPLITALGTPFEVLCTVYGFEDLYEDLSARPEMLKEILEKIIVLLFEYGRQLQDAGADVLMVVDGTSQMLMPEQFKKFSAPYAAKLIKEFEIPTILHVCGNSLRLLDDMAETGANALSIDWPVPIDKAREATHGKCALVGALDVNRLYLEEPADVREMVEDCAQKGYDIIAPGCGVIPSTPLTNMLEFSNAIKSLSNVETPK